MKKEHIIRFFGIMLILIGGVLIIIEKHFILAQIITLIGVVAGLIYAHKKGIKKSNEKIRNYNFLINLLMIVTISFIAVYSFAKYL